MYTKTLYINFINAITMQNENTNDYLIIFKVVVRLNK